MCQLIETIRIENGEPLLLPLHQKRMDKARTELFGSKEPSSLSAHLLTLSLPHSGIWKCRVTYGLQIEKTEFEPYQKRAVQSLKIIEADELNYDYKFAQRTEINKLFSMKSEADDILIIRNKLLTDTSYCNIALWNGSEWITPLQPLLKGVRRESLIQQKKIKPLDIQLNDLPFFQRIKLFNAMISFEEATEISTSSIFS
jgi:4-amino-4-deoxychorismate lyase